MRKSMNVLTVMLLLSAALFLFQKKIDFFLLLFSAGMGLLALTEMNVDWQAKLDLKRSDANFLKERFEITTAGKMSGFLSSISLAFYFVLKL